VPREELETMVRALRAENAALRRQAPEQPGVPFSLEDAAIYAGFAFESYNAPKGARWERGATGIDVAYSSPKFVRECVAGALVVKIKRARNLPDQKDLPEVALTGARSDPYVTAAVVEGGDLRAGNATDVARTRTIWRKGGDDDDDDSKKKKKTKPMEVDDDDEESVGTESSSENWLREGNDFLGRMVIRKFNRNYTEGVVVAYAAPTDEDPALWRVEHADGDEEDLEESELLQAVADHCDAFKKYANAKTNRNAFITDYLSGTHTIQIKKSLVDHGYASAQILQYLNNVD